MIRTYEEFARALEDRPTSMSVLSWLAARTDDRGDADWSLWTVRWLREHPHDALLVNLVGVEIE